MRQTTFHQCIQLLRANTATSKNDSQVFEILKSACINYPVLFLQFSVAVVEFVLKSPVLGVFTLLFSARMLSVFLYVEKCAVILNNHHKLNVTSQFNASCCNVMKMGVSRENIINLSFESIKAIVVHHFKLCSLECNFNAVKVMKLTIKPSCSDYLTLPTRPMRSLTA